VTQCGWTYLTRKTGIGFEAAKRADATIERGDPEGPAA